MLTVYRLQSWILEFGPTNEIENTKIQRMKPLFESMDTYSRHAYLYSAWTAMIIPCLLASAMIYYYEPTSELQDFWKAATASIPVVVFLALGECYDIHHKSGDVLNTANNTSNSYGVPFVFMRRKFSDKVLLDVNKPKFGVFKYNGCQIPYMTPSKANPDLINYLINKAYDTFSKHKA